jgi:hypothetical protein
MHYSHREDMKQLVVQITEVSILMIPLMPHSVRETHVSKIDLIVENHPI